MKEVAREAAATLTRVLPIRMVARKSSDPGQDPLDDRRPGGSPSFPGSRGYRDSTPMKAVSAELKKALRRTQNDEQQNRRSDMARRLRLRGRL